MAHILLVGCLLHTFVFYVISNLKFQSLNCLFEHHCSRLLSFHEMICVRKVGIDCNIHYYKMINNILIAIREYRKTKPAPNAEHANCKHCGAHNKKQEDIYLESDLSEEAKKKKQQANKKSKTHMRHTI